MRNAIRTTEPRDVQFVMRLTKSDKVMLTELATEADVSAGEYIRKLLRREHAKLEAKR